MNKDLTAGKPEKVLWKFCLPLFGSIIFQQLYNIADSFVAGKFISDNALAAVGNSYEITLIFIAFAFGCNIACSVLAARYFGAKQYRDMKTTVYTALIASAAICAVLMLLGVLLAGGLLRLIKTPDEIFADSKLYLDIYIYGFPTLYCPAPFIFKLFVGAQVHEPVLRHQIVQSSGAAETVARQMSRMIARLFSRCVPHIRQTPGSFGKLKLLRMPIGNPSLAICLICISELTRLIGRIRQ